MQVCCNSAARFTAASLCPFLAQYGSYDDAELHSLVAQIESRTKAAGRWLAGVARHPRAAVEAREDSDFLIAARSDASWIGLGFDETLRRLQAYADAGADLVFPTLVTADQVAEIRRRIGKPVMIVDLPNGTLEDEARAGASLVLYYGFSALVQFDALGRALERFKATRDANAVPGYRERVREFEDFMGYREFTERARRYGAPEK